MRIAYCLSGHCRTFDVCYQSFAEHILPYKPDVYIHTWTKRWSETPTWHGAEPKNEEDTPIEALVKLYSPRAFAIEGQDRKTYEEGMKALHYGMNHVLNLAMATDEYDIVIRSRFDLMFYRVNLELKADVMSPIDGSYWSHGGINDMFAYGNPKGMKVYGSYQHGVTDITTVGFGQHVRNQCSVALADVRFDLVRQTHVLKIRGMNN